MIGAMAKQRKIAVVTGSRAEFGLLQPVIHAIVEHTRLEPAVIVAGYHLVSGTWRDVKKAGFEVTRRVPMQKHGVTPSRAGDVAAVGQGVGRFGRTFEMIAPDVVLVLGDRIEVFAAATAAHIGGYRLAHVHGGDRAEGVADESMRHAVTKLAHLHYAATPTSARRIIRMGEQPEHVLTVGSPAVDGLDEVSAADDAPEVIVLQHPIGAAVAEEKKWMRQTLAATAKQRRLVVAPNGDPGSEGIREAIEAEGVDVAEHLPRRRWLELLAGAKVIVGNSSAGLIEAAVLRTACVNIGPRQAGRERAANVIDSDYGRQNVEAAVRQALELDLRRLRHPYGEPGAGRRIADHLATFDPAGVPIRKRNAY